METLLGDLAFLLGNGTMMNEHIDPVSAHAFRDRLGR